MIQKEKKSARSSLEYATHEGDTGSPEVQIAILTARINELTEHLRVAQARQPLPPRPAHDGRQAPQACSTTWPTRTSTATALIIAQVWASVSNHDLWARPPAVRPLFTVSPSPVITPAHGSRRLAV